MIKSITFYLLIMIGLNCSPARCQTITGKDSADLNLTALRSKWEYGTGYFWPTSINNQVTTLTLDAGFWKNYFKKLDLRFHIGLVAAYAEGTVKTVPKDPREQGISHPTKAAGLGPTLMVQYPFIVIRSFSVEAEISGSFLLFTNRFPYGGYLHNFMFRTGPNICWTASNNLAFKLGYRWFHVSNGSGGGPQNPWYNARGLTLAVTRFIR